MSSILKYALLLHLASCARVRVAVQVPLEAQPTAGEAAVLAGELLPQHEQPAVGELVVSQDAQPASAEPVALSAGLPQQAQPLVGGHALLDADLPQRVQPVSGRDEHAPLAAEFSQQAQPTSGEDVAIAAQFPQQAQPTPGENVAIAAQFPQHAQQTSAGPAVLAAEPAVLASAGGFPIQGFPVAPPVALTAPLAPLLNDTLGGGPITTATVGFRVRRQLTITGRDLLVNAPDGSTLYTTQGDFFTMRAHTHFFEGGFGREIAMSTKTFWTLRKVYEIHSYEPVCPGQLPESERGTGGRSVYAFARLTESLFSMFDHWTVERYSCDGSLVTMWEISSRNWFTWGMHRYDVWGDGQLVGSLDQAFFFQMTSNYNAFISANADLPLFAMVATLVDMAHLHRKSGDNTGEAGGGGGGGGTHNWADDVSRWLRWGMAAIHGQ